MRVAREANRRVEIEQQVLQPARRAEHEQEESSGGKDRDLFHLVASEEDADQA